MNLRVKFIVPTLILIIIGSIVTSIVSYNSSTKTLNNIIINESNSSVSDLLSLIDIWVNGSKNEVATLSRSYQAISQLKNSSTDSNNNVENLFESVISRHSTFDIILLINKDGMVINTTNEKLRNKDLSTREYFQKALQGQISISPPIISSVDGKPIFTISSPVFDNGKIIGVVAAGIKIDEFSKKFIIPHTTQSSYMFISAENGVCLAHPDAKLVGKFNVLVDSDYGDKFIGHDKGILDVTSLGTKKLIFFKTSPITKWIIGMAVNKEVAFHDAESLGNLILGLSGGQAILLLAGIWFILSISVIKPTHELVKAARRIAEGDLNTVLDVNRKDEIGMLQQALSAMVSTLKVKIGEAEKQGDIAKEETEKAKEAMAEAQEAKEAAERARREGTLMAAQQLESIVDAITSATHSISDQIDQSSRGSQDQSDRVGETATAMEEMNATVMEVARNAAEAATTAENARDQAGEGSKIVSQVIESIDDAQSKALSLKSDMTTLGEQAQGIGQIMNVISDIADQTNLLALNAAIEAARAGDAGRGFAVVADEVRKLAEKTMTATKEVGDAITGIQNGTTRNIDNVDIAVQRINEATNLANQSGEALNSIVSLVDRTTDQVRSIATAAEQQSATTDEINRSVMDISRIASETADALHQSSDALGGLADQTGMLNQLIQNMQSDTDMNSTNSMKSLPGKKIRALPRR